RKCHASSIACRHESTRRLVELLDAAAEVKSFTSCHALGFAFPFPQSGRMRLWRPDFVVEAAGSLWMLALQPIPPEAEGEIAQWCQRINKWGEALLADLELARPAGDRQRQGLARPWRFVTLDLAALQEVPLSANFGVLTGHLR
ncbi:MAG: hypothetical protein KGR26_13580, partial [Cyanobacteria bacterium REEB65]|nr:hypothetical protein [Cyanobacteria bacterium REEB65]